jgi:hypothetical protein
MIVIEHQHMMVRGAGQTGGVVPPTGLDWYSYPLPDAIRYIL